MVLVRDCPRPEDVARALGNGVDPIDMIAKYGVDAMRYYITTNSTPGMDMRYSDEKLEAAEAYLNKIWNACRYVEGVLGDAYQPVALDKKKLSTLDAAILDRLEHTIKRVTTKMDQYQFGQASSYLYDFVYDDFCSSYLENSKICPFQRRRRGRTHQSRPLHGDARHHPHDLSLCSVRGRRDVSLAPGTFGKRHAGKLS
jgi:valyl-tRNA synthetase